jgi:hypothetical protein
MAALIAVIAGPFVIASEAKQSPARSLRRFVAALLAMTNALLAMTLQLSLRAKRSNLRDDLKFSIT